MKLRAVLLAAACTVAVAPSAAAADEVRVLFANGRVSVIADNATLGEILREWTRAGGSQFVNAEKIPSAERLTLRLENEDELRAIEVLLRSVAGYAIAPRAAGMRGASSIGKVLIMPVMRPATIVTASSTPPPAPVTPRLEQMEQEPRLDQMRRLQQQAAAAPPQPDDDGPVRQEVPPPFNGQPMPGMQNNPASQPAPAGQASPNAGAPTRTLPGFGVVTSSQPGAIIPNAMPGRPAGRPAPISPTQPRRPGGGG